MFDIIKDISLYLVIAFLSGVGVGVVSLLIVIGPTDTTDKSWSKRFGLTLHIDNETGIQYLSKVNCGLTPRLDREGRPMVVAHE